MTHTISEIKKAHVLLKEFAFEPVQLERGYANRYLRINLDNNEISILPVTQQMKDLWIGGKGFDLWLTFQEIKDIKDFSWESNENPICFSPGPLAGTTSFPGSGKTLVTAVSPATSSIMDCNVGGYFGPFLKFAGFDSLVLVGKSAEEVIVFIDAVNHKITIEKAPLESLDSHVVAEELTKMYADNEIDMRNIAVVSAGSAAEHARMGLLNFSFWDWRRNVARLKQAGRGGIGTVFRKKGMKALVIKNRGITPAWRVEENKVAAEVTPKTIQQLTCEKDLADLKAIIASFGNDPERAFEILLAVQERFKCIPKTAIEMICKLTGQPKSYLYHLATFHDCFTLDPEKKRCGDADCDCEDDECDHEHDEDGEEEDSEMPEGEIRVVAPNPIVTCRDNAFAGLEKAIKMTPEAVLGEIKASELLLKDTTGIPAYQKWESVCSAATADKKPVVVTNVVLNGINEAKIVEGLMISAYATGADQAFILLHSKMDLEAFETAVATGQQIFNLKIDIRLIGDDYLLNKDKSVLSALKGFSSEPYKEFKHITQHGYHERPTLIHNNETMASVGAAIFHGAEWFKKHQTKVFEVYGDVKNPAVVELPYGSTIGAYITAAGGSDGAINAIQFGSFGGPMLKATRQELKTDYETLREAGIVLDSSEIDIYNKQTPVTDLLAENIACLSFDSCGKCGSCREGLFHASRLADKIADGKARKGDLEAIGDLAECMRETSFCQYGVNAGKSIMKSIKEFGDKFAKGVK